MIEPVTSESISEALHEAFGMWRTKRNRAGRRQLLTDRPLPPGGTKVPKAKRQQEARKAAKRAAASRRANRA